MLTTIQEVLATDAMIDELLTHGTIGGHESLARLRQENYPKSVLLDGRGCDGRERAYGGIAFSYGLTVVQLEDALYHELIRQLQVKLGDRRNGGRTKVRVSPLYYEIVRFNP